jgi:hypothetical protein
VPVEVGQLYHAPWIDSIRRTSDLACYALGDGPGILIGLANLHERSAART